MFTGIVDRGRVTGVEQRGEGLRLWVEAQRLAGAEVGASVAVNGVCLTVVEVDNDRCAFDVVPETVSRSTVADRRAGDVVNVERPLRAGDEFGGHIVQGHVDGIGQVTSIEDDEKGRRVRIAMPDEMSRYVVEKGSIAIDGVSLTVSAVDGAEFEVALIPHTLAVTTFGDVTTGTRVNLEVDVLAKYVEKMLARAS